MLSGEMQGSRNILSPTCCVPWPSTKFDHLKKKDRPRVSSKVNEISIAVAVVDDYDRQSEY